MPRSIARPMLGACIVLALMIGNLGSAASDTGRGSEGPSSSSTTPPDPRRAPGLLSGLTTLTGTPWRPGSADRPGYSNTLIPAEPRVDQLETAVVRRLRNSIVNISDYAEPIYYSGVGTPMREVSCPQYGCVGGDRAPLRGDEVVAGGSDGQLVVVDLERRRTYELWDVEQDADGTVAVGPDGSVTAGSMSVVDLDGRGNVTAEGELLNITGAGLSRFTGVIRAPEVQRAATTTASAIDHALQVALPPDVNCSGPVGVGFREPATKSDGRAPAGPCVQQGARLQMDPAFDCSVVVPALGRAVCHALQRYGAFVVDNGGTSSVVFYGQHRATWPTAAADYAAAGIRWDYDRLGFSPSRLRVLARWDGR